MKEKLMVRGVLVGVLALMIIAYVNVFDRQVEMVITFYNDTNQVIEGLYLEYTGDSNELEMPPFNPDEKYEIRIQPNEEFVEGSMTLFYLDKQGQKHTVTIVEEVKKGYRLDVEARITAIDENGELSFLVE